MSYLKLGQYRKVNDLNDGVSQYQCMWCKSHIRIFDDPNYWNFCPLCGKSWFKRMKTRPHYQPRWHWDLHGHECDGPCWYSTPPEPTSKWVIEQRSKWFDNDWGAWTEYVSCPKDPCGPDWQWARSILVDRRNHNPGDDEIKYQYRARIEKLV